jgi:hypothetical protein
LSRRSGIGKIEARRGQRTEGSDKKVGLILSGLLKA